MFYNNEKVKSLMQYKHCSKCDKVRPPRSHHCKTCGKCVMRMDHHCPFTGNCVGKGNYKLFFLFCFYTVLGALWDLNTMGSFSNDMYYKLRADKEKFVGDPYFEKV